MLKKILKNSKTSVTIPFDKKKK